MANNNAKVQFVDISEACGGTFSQVGDSQYFVDDGLHLNKRGYCAAFSITGVQAALGCTGQVDPTVCAGITMIGCEGSAGTNSPNPSPSPSNVGGRSSTSLVVTAAALAATLILIVN